MAWGSPLQLPGYSTPPQKWEEEEGGNPPGRDRGKIPSFPPSALTLSSWAQPSAVPVLGSWPCEARTKDESTVLRL